MGTPLAGIAIPLGRCLGREVEVEEHGGTVSRDQDVGRFQIPVEQSPRVGMFEPLGQSGDDPDRGLDAVGPAQELTRRRCLVLIIVFSARQSRSARTDQPGHETPKSPDRRRPLTRKQNAAIGLDFLFLTARDDLPRSRSRSRAGPARLSEAPRRFLADEGRQPLAELIQGFHQAPPRGLDMGEPPRLLQELSQVGPAEERHAEQAKPCG